MSFLRHFSKKVLEFRGKKPLPDTTLVIITSNNADSLRYLLNELKNNPLYQSNRGQIIVVDYYSYDYTKETVHEYVGMFGKEIILKDKISDISISNTVHPYLSNQLVQVINLAEIQKANHYLPANKYNKWLKNINIFSKKTKKVDPLKIIEKMESDRSNVYHILKHSVIEPISNLQMVLSEMQNVDSAKDLLNTLNNKLQDTLQHFDPSLYSQDTFALNVGGFLKDFTEKTQIDTNLIEVGEEQRVQYQFGLSVLRIIKHFFSIVEKSGTISNVDLKIRWRKEKLILSMKFNGFRKGLTLKEHDCRFIDERANLLNGRCKFITNNPNKVECLITMPLYLEKGDKVENEKK